MTERDQAIGQMYRAGKPMSEIAEVYGLTRQRVLQILQDTGEHKKAKVVTALQIKELAQKVIDAGGDLTLAEVTADEAGISPEAVHTAIQDLGHDYHDLRQERRRRMHLARVEGIGEATCCQCGETKSWSEFARRKTRDGIPTRMRRCKDCTSANVREIYAKNKGRNEQPTVDSKECSNCGKTKKADEFHRDTSTVTGLQGWCKECRAEWRSF